MSDCGTHGAASRQKKIILPDMFLTGVLDVCLMGFFIGNISLNDEQKSNK